MVQFLNKLIELLINSEDKNPQSLFFYLYIIFITRELKFSKS